MMIQQKKEPNRTETLDYIFNDNPTPSTITKKSMAELLIPRYSHNLISKLPIDIR